MANIILIHGAFHGGWCWRDVAEPLRRDGHRVFAPSLTGLGDRSHLLNADVDLDTHIADVRNLIETEELDEVVLVGHSYGGMPITGVADVLAERLSALVYLDAIMPEDGESAMVIRTRVPGATLAMDRPADGVGVPAPPAHVFGPTGAIGAWVDRQMTPHPFATMTQPIRLTGAWRGVARKIYIRTGLYASPYFDLYHEAAAADDDWVAIRREVIHNIAMTEPDWFLDILREHAL